MWAFYSAIQAALDLLRKCPKCGNEQKVKVAMKNKTVICSKCGNKLPPHKHKLS